MFTYTVQDIIRLGILGWFVLGVVVYGLIYLTAFIVEHFWEMRQRRIYFTEMHQRELDAMGEEE